MGEEDNLLIGREKYLSSGIHIGMTVKTADMKRFIYKIRPNGLAVLNIGMLDQRIRHLANLLSKTRRIMVVSRRESAKDAINKFCEVVGAKCNAGRFMPGSLTNPKYKEFMEPQILIVVDPSVDKQAMKEAIQMRIPIVGLVDTSNNTDFLDIILPCNNKAKKSLALLFWLLARETMKNRKEEFKHEMKDFGYEEDK